MKFLISILLLSINTIAQQLNSPIKFLALGDSYTIGQSVAESERWPNQLTDSLMNYGYTFDTTQIIARTGWTTRNLMNGILQANVDSSYNLVGLLIGVNNQFQGRSIGEYRTELDSLIRWSIALAGDNPNQVFLVSIPDYGYTPFGNTSNRERISNEINLFNGVKDSLAAEYNIPYYYITDISRKGIQNPELVANDNLHPSGKQYTEWVAKMLPLMLSRPSIVLETNSDNLNISTHNKSVQVSLNKPFQLAIIDAAGQTLGVKTGSNTYSFDLKSAGIYFLQIQSGEQMYTRKIMIQ